MKRLSSPRAALLTAVAVLLPVGGLLAGCSRDNDGLSAEQRQAGDRLSEIARKTDGDWNKLTEADRDFLVNQMSHGNEQSARMLLLGAAGKIGGRPGGPPR